MNKFLFLDIDGVLNCNKTQEKFGFFLGLDPELVDRYLKWLKTSKVTEVILSSTWRDSHQAREHLIDNGIHWDDITPVHRNHGPRGFEIQHWMDDSNVEPESIAILDDIPDMVHLQSRLVHTDEAVGLQDSDLLKVDELLR